MVLLARRAFVGRIGSSDDDVKSVVDVESESALEAFYDDLDTDMRTFHHRKEFDDRTVACSGEAVVRLGLTDEERAMRLDIANFMKIAPLAVQAECSAWRALGYFRAAGFDTSRGGRRQSGRRDVDASGSACRGGDGLRTGRRWGVWSIARNAREGFRKRGWVAGRRMTRWPTEGLLRAQRGRRSAP